MVAPKRKISAVVTLFFVAPLVAEYLLGDLPLQLLLLVILFAPFYGAGAVLIRELARRAGRGWPTMLMLGAAYTLIEEGLVTQSLFNHDYLKMHMHLLDPAYIPSLGIGGWWTAFMFNLHTFWSMGVSIALVEAMFPAEAEAPWLGRVGDWVVGAIFVFGVVVNFGIGYKQNEFVATRHQLLSVAVLSVLLMVCAFLLPVRRPRAGGDAVPAAWIMGAIAFVFGTAVMYTPPTWGWRAVGVLLALDLVFLVVVGLLSRRTGWSALHTFSLAAGGAVTYGVHAFMQKPLLGSLLWARVSNAVFFVAALWVIWLGARRGARYQT